MSTRKKDTRVVVRRAGYRQGYTGADHLLRHHEVADAVVGRCYKSEHAAKEAAEAAAEAAGTHVPVCVDVIYLDAIPYADMEDAVGRAAETRFIECGRYYVAVSCGGYAMVHGLGECSDVGSVRLYVS